MVQNFQILSIILLVAVLIDADGSETKGAFSCFYPPDPGNCDPSKGSIKWFYHLYAAQCQKFLYSNCGGNLNRFNSEAECLNVCRQWMLSSVATTNKPSNAETLPTVTTPLISLPTPASLISSLSKCLLPKAPGSMCPTSNTLSATEKSRWYWNFKKWECLQFTYKGCEGNANNFRSKFECLLSCQPADGPTCTAAATEFVSKGVELGDRNSCATLNCPATHVCQMGAFFADCCPKTGEEFECPNGGKPYELNPNEGYLLADTCEDIRCPAEYVCKAGKIFSLCCPQRSFRPSGADFADYIPSDHFACLEPKDLQPCPAGVFERWFYDSVDQTCRRNNQSCLVSTNNFQSLDECRDICFHKRRRQHRRFSPDRNGLRLGDKKPFSSENPLLVP